MLMGSRLRRPRRAGSAAGMRRLSASPRDKPSRLEPRSESARHGTGPAAPALPGALAAAVPQPFECFFPVSWQKPRHGHLGLSDIRGSGH